MNHIHYCNVHVALYAATHLHGYKVHTKHCRTALGYVEGKYQIMQCTCITVTNTLIGASLSEPYTCKLEIFSLVDLSVIPYVLIMLTHMQFFTFIQFNINIILTLSSCSLKFGHNALHFNLYLAVEHTHCKMVQFTLTSIIA